MNGGSRARGVRKPGLRAVVVLALAVLAIATPTTLQEVVTRIGVATVGLGERLAHELSARVLEGSSGVGALWGSSATANALPIAAGAVASLRWAASTAAGKGA